MGPARLPLGLTPIKQLAGLERENLSGVPDLVLEGLANAPALDDAEREHLFDLASAAGFYVDWAAHNVRFHRTGTKRIHHPIVGEMQLSFETMMLTADPGLAINGYTAEPGSRSEETLRLLASWTTTPDREAGRGPEMSRQAPVQRERHIAPR